LWNVSKGSLGQHFLNDKNIAVKIVDSMSYKGYNNLLEIGPGTGILTRELIKKKTNLKVVEIDNESVEYLNQNLISLRNNIINEDFLKINLNNVFNGKAYAIIGNFPYNISSQIVFKILESRAIIPEFCGMFQKEVLDNIS
jgi:16S rRNA (adenine1518-N6/adenine1519-N6)-dimethyltransferase